MAAWMFVCSTSCPGTIRELRTASLSQLFGKPTDLSYVAQVFATSAVAVDGFRSLTVQAAFLHRHHILLRGPSQSGPMQATVQCSAP